jgi:ParB-like chromosome segregation protein Spo0J
MTLPTVTVTIDQLFSTDDNMRVVKHDEADKRTLKSSILSIGLLQPMVVAERPKIGRKKAEGYVVVAGEGRRTALAELADEFPERRAMTWDCVLISDPTKISEVSLAENYARKQPRIAEIYRGFANMKADRPDLTTEQIGAVFGYDGPRSARIMRLANLAPELMTLYVAGRMDDAQAMAYAATEDQALQIAVHQQLAEKPHDHQRSAHSIRAAMNVGDHELTRLIRYVGVDAYREAGGDFEADLFQKEGTGRIMHPAILHTLAGTKMADDRDRFEHTISRNGRVLGENWGTADLRFSWAEEPPQIKQYGYSQTDSELAIREPKRGPLSDQDEARCVQITNRLTVLGGEHDQIAEADEEEAARLESELADLEDARSIILPKKGAVVGIATLDTDGEFTVALYYASRAEKGLEVPKGTKATAAAAAPQTPEEAERARYGLSKDNMQGLMLMRRDMIREELFYTAASGSTLAMDWLLYSQARTILRGVPSWNGGTNYPGDQQGILSLPEDDDGSSKLHGIVKDRPERAKWAKIKADMRAQVWADVRDPAEGFYLFRAEGQDVKNKAAALVAGHMLMATTSNFNDGRTPRMVRELANNIEAEPGFNRWRDDLDMNEDLFAMFSHKARLDLLDQWGMGDRAKGMKSSETAGFCARVVNCDEADAQLLGFHPDDLGEAQCWMPDFLETAPIESLPEPTPEDDDDDQQDEGGDDATLDADDLAEAD